MFDREPEDFRITSTTQQIWGLFKQNKIALACFYLFIVLALVTLLTPFFVHNHANTQFVGNELIPPLWQDGNNLKYLFGTDDIGRDIFYRILAGAHYTLGAAFVVVFITLIFGGGLACWLGMKSSKPALFFNDLLNAFLSVPILFIAIIISSLMHASLTNAMLAITLALLPHFIHECYKAIREELEKDYIIMLRLDGASHWVLFKESIFPSMIPMLIKETTRLLTMAILDISALSFISLGAQAPLPEWGALIKDYMNIIYLAPWAVVLPGMAIIFSILIIILLGNGLQHAVEKYNHE